MDRFGSRGNLAGGKNKYIYIYISDSSSLLAPHQLAFSRAFPGHKPPSHCLAPSLHCADVIRIVYYKYSTIHSSCACHPHCARLRCIRFVNTAGMMARVAGDQVCAC